MNYDCYMLMVYNHPRRIFVTLGEAIEYAATLGNQKDHVMVFGVTFGSEFVRIKL